MRADLNETYFVAEDLGRSSMIDYRQVQTTFEIGKICKLGSGLFDLERFYARIRASEENDVSRQLATGDFLFRLSRT